LWRKAGIKVVRRLPSYILSRHNLQYTTVRNTKHHVKIEINYLERLPIGKIVERNTPSLFPDIDSFTSKTYSLEELAAQKVKACIERAEPRDIYDVYCLSKQNLELEMIKKYAVVYYCITEEKLNLDDFWNQ